MELDLDFTADAVGDYFRAKYRQRVVDSGGDYAAVARQLRKQGVPLSIALALLGFPLRRV